LRKRIFSIGLPIGLKNGIFDKIFLDIARFCGIVTLKREYL
jgi:hypothetical protein